MPSRCRRLMLLTVVAKVRTVGWAPWLAVLLLGGMAALGEPSLFRSFATWLPYQAVGAVAAVLLVVLLGCAPSPRDSRARLGSHLLLLVATTLAVGFVLTVLDASVAHRWDVASLEAALLFAVALLPATLGFAARHSVADSAQNIIRQGVIAIQPLVSVAIVVHVSAAGWSGPSVGAAASCTIGCMVLVACSDARAMMGPDHEDRNSR